MRAAAVAALVALAACGRREGGGDAERAAETTSACPAAGAPGATAETAVAGPPDSLTFAPATGVDLARMTRTGSGLYVQDVTPGTGDSVAAGRAVKVCYAGKLANGKQFDANAGGAPFELTVGEGRVIPGWEEGLVGMKRGGVRRLVIPPALGYGAAGAGGVIPPNATLVFDVRLLDVR